jgi:heme/copper-type cytochrome/quinol oxidase subunit 1
VADIAGFDHARDFRWRGAAEAGRGISVEPRAWAALAVGSLAIAGIFAALLAVSRLPGIERVFPWPLGFFAKGLVIHVVFSFVIWFVAMFALLTSLATVEISNNPVRLDILGRIGAALVSLSFPMLFLPAFVGSSEASLNNYVPVIIHQGYYAGLGVLALGVLLPVVRLFANLPSRSGRLSPLAVAMTAGGVIYVAALVCFAAALTFAWGTPVSIGLNEHLFWGGGHILQSLYCVLMLVCWYELSRASFGEDVVDPEVFRTAVMLLALFSVLGPVFYRVFEPFSASQNEAFTKLQFVLALPTLIVSVGGLVGIVRRSRRAPLPWHNPAFIALVLSALVFGIGGVMGFLVGNGDTRTPAHYHGMIAGVTVACMGMLFAYCLPRLDRPVAANRAIRIQLYLFGVGQLVASIGLFLAGGYGAPRKMPTEAGRLLSEAVVGMYLNGIGGLLAVVGGVMFVIIGLAALGRGSGNGRVREPIAPAAQDN